MTHESICAVFGDTGDFIARKLRCGGHTIYAYMIDGLIASVSASDMVFKPLSKLPEGPMQSLYDAALDGTVYNNVADPCSDEKAVASKLVNGFVVVLFPGVGAVAYEVKTPEKRSVSPPTVENTIKGPKDAFTETVSGIAVAVSTPDGCKCDRCWSYSTEGKAAEDGFLCARCLNIIEE